MLGVLWVYGIEKWILMRVGKSKLMYLRYGVDNMFNVTW